MDFPKIQHCSKIAYDTETTGLQYPVDRVFGFSISTPEVDFYVDIRQHPKAVLWLNDAMDKYTGIVACHNASFDYRMSHSTGIYLPIEQLDDTVIRACLIDEHLHEYNLDFLCKKYLGEGKYGDIYQELADVFGGRATRNMQMPNLQFADPELVAPYATVDSRRTLDLHDYQDKQIGRQRIFDIVDFERDLMPQFIETEMHGIRVDLDYAEQAMNALTPPIREAQSHLDELAGHDLNVNSTPQVRAMFGPEQQTDGSWVTRDGLAMESTDGGQACVNAEFLRSIDDERAKLVLQIRSDIKTRDTFLGKHVLEHSVGDRVYPTINQSKGDDGGTGTGRLSYTGPALQQIPSRRKIVAAIVKPCFLPDEGQVWVDTDMNSFEVRTFFDLVGNKEMIAEYHKNPLLDAHQHVADLTNLVRNAEYGGQPNAKQLNLSMIFNSGNGAIAEKMGLPFTHDSFVPRGKTEKDRIHYKKAGIKAMDIIDRYHARFPGIRELAERCKDEALDIGYVETYYGRRLRFPRGFKAYKASGLLIQATAADWNKENWGLIKRELEDSGGRLLLNTHDSYGLSLDEKTWADDYVRIKYAIESRGRSKVPLILDLNGKGKNWHDALVNKQVLPITEPYKGATYN